MAEKKINQEATETPEVAISYEEALKAFKAQWADKRKEERASKRNSVKEEQRAKDVEHVKVALEALNKVEGSENKRQLKCVVTRLEMFIKGEHYTRSN